MNLYDDDALEEYDDYADQDEPQDEDDDRALDDEGEPSFTPLLNDIIESLNEYLAEFDEDASESGEDEDGMTSAVGGSAGRGRVIGSSRLDQEEDDSFKSVDPHS